MSNLARNGFSFNFPSFQGGAVAIANGPGAVAVANSKGSLSYAEAIAIGENARAFANANPGEAHMAGNIVENNGGGYYYWSILQPFSNLYNYMWGGNTVDPPSNRLQHREEH